jgi:hypothetical protein
VLPGRWPELRWWSDPDSGGDPAALIGLGVDAIRLIVTPVASRRRLRAGPFRVSGEVDDVALESGEMVGAVHDGLIQSLPGAGERQVVRPSGLKKHRCRFGAERRALGAEELLRALSTLMSGPASLGHALPSPALGASARV